MFVKLQQFRNVIVILIIKYFLFIFIYYFITNHTYVIDSNIDIYTTEGSTINVIHKSNKIWKILTQRYTNSNFLKTVFPLNFLKFAGKTCKCFTLVRKYTCLTTMCSKFLSTIRPECRDFQFVTYKIMCSKLA